MDQRSTQFDIVRHTLSEGVRTLEEDVVAQVQVLYALNLIFFKGGRQLLKLLALQVAVALGRDR